MSAITAEDLKVFVEQLKRLLADRSSEAEVRRLSETPEGYDPAVWKALADLGVTGLIIDEAHGGFGGDAVALELVMEEVGAALLCSPLLSSAILAPALLQALDDDAAKARLLHDLASGKRIATVAITGPSAPNGLIRAQVSVEKITTKGPFRRAASFVAVCPGLTVPSWVHTTTSSASFRMTL